MLKQTRHIRPELFRGRVLSVVMKEDVHSTQGQKDGGIFKEKMAVEQEITHEKGSETHP